MRIYQDEKGTIIIDGEGTALYTDSQLTDKNSIAQVVKNELPNNIDIMFTQFNIIGGTNDQKLESFNRFLDKGTLFENRE